LVFLLPGLFFADRRHEYIVGLGAACSCAPRTDRLMLSCDCCCCRELPWPQHG
jgi:hypothetical protein